MKASELIKGQTYILKDEKGNTRTEVEFLYKANVKYAFKDINAPSVYYFTNGYVENKIAAK